MVYNPYTLWNMYVVMRTIHGIYITYSFMNWFLGSLSGTMYYMISFIYNPYEMKQLENRKQSNIDDID